MASTIPSTLLELDNGDGTTTPLASITIKVWDVTGAADVATITTDAHGYFPATSVSRAAGAVYRLRCENYQGRTGYVELLSA